MKPINHDRLCGVEITVEDPKGWKGKGGGGGGREEGKRMGRKEGISELERGSGRGKSKFGEGLGVCGPIA